MSLTQDLLEHTELLSRRSAKPAWLQNPIVPSICVPSRPSPKSLNLFSLCQRQKSKPRAKKGAHTPKAMSSRIGINIKNPIRIPVIFGSSPPSQDRKSTRLNSSHLGISYAVFCLKKKKKLHKP